MTNDFSGLGTTNHKLQSKEKNSDLVFIIKRFNTINKIIKYKLEKNEISSGNSLPQNFKTNNIILEKYIILKQKLLKQHLWGKNNFLVITQINVLN